MRFGLSAGDEAYIVAALTAFPEIRRAAIFGSRAKGTAKPGSDVDLAIWGEAVTFDTVAGLHARLEDESPMPYRFDVVDCTHLAQANLKEHIDRVAVSIFERGPES
ncbi:MAG: nucleotidyltransferase domain-containing protein [Lentisphaeria bacterium]